MRPIGEIELDPSCRQMRDGELVAPLGKAGEATLGAFFLDLAGRQREAASTFADWLRAEARRDAAGGAARRAAAKRHSKSA